MYFYDIAWIMTLITQDFDYTHAVQFPLVLCAIAPNSMAFFPKLVPQHRISNAGLQNDMCD
jgi:hypothetical protein